MTLLAYVVPFGPVESREVRHADSRFAVDSPSNRSRSTEDYGSQKRRRCRTQTSSHSHHKRLVAGTHLKYFSARYFTPKLLHPEATGYQLILVRWMLGSPCT